MSADDPSFSHVVIYSSPLCGYCGAAVRLLKMKGAEFLEINVEQNPQHRQEMAKLSGRKTVPQIFIGGRSIGGYTELNALEMAGELESLLAEQS
jgi:glutaredoxin 3|tara:strand:+ start:605 stop:886 length:282 start_codon:yes stop_codon:yes gene_type:complete